MELYVIGLYDKETGELKRYFASGRNGNISCYESLNSAKRAVGYIQRTSYHYSKDNIVVQKITELTNVEI